VKARVVGQQAVGHHRAVAHRGVAVTHRLHGGARPEGHRTVPDIWLGGEAAGQLQLTLVSASAPVSLPLSAASTTPTFSVGKLMAWPSPGRRAGSASMNHRQFRPLQNMDERGGHLPVKTIYLGEKRIFWRRGRPRPGC
jgi:hypothetical protein